MSEHSIEELQRQRDAAKGRLANADADFRGAEQQLNQAKIAAEVAKFEAAGHKLGVTRVRQTGWGGEAILRGAPYVVTGFRVSYGNVAPIFAKIKKDGTPSASPVSGGSGYAVRQEDQPK